MDLNERKLQILKSIVDEYIVNGEPVGSKHLASSGNMSLSPATIRNEMSELEEMGYLDKPHTSAGRIPSNAAYRIYIDKLMESYRLNVEELNLLNELQRFKMDEMEKMVSKATKVISEITNCATLSLMTSNKKHVVSRFDALLIDEKSFVLVMVLPDGSVKSRHIVTPVMLDSLGIETIKSSLNRNLCNISLDDVALPVLLRLESEFGTLSPLVTTVVKNAYEAVGGRDEQKVRVDGLTNLLSYPEFTDVGKVKNILEFIENDDSRMKDVLFDGENDSKALKVYIGDENKASELSDTSVVYCNLPIGDGQNAVIGIIGPKRMDYKKVMSALHKLADTLDVKLLSDGESTEL